MLKLMAYLGLLALTLLSPSALRAQFCAIPRVVDFTVQRVFAPNEAIDVVLRVGKDIGLSGFLCSTLDVNIVSFHVDAPGAQLFPGRIFDIGGTFGLDQCGFPSTADEIFFGNLIYNTPGPKTVSVTVSQCNAQSVPPGTTSTLGRVAEVPCPLFEGPRCFVLLTPTPNILSTTAVSFTVIGPPVPQKFLHIVAKNLHTDPNGNLVSDASSLQRLDLPAGADRLSQPFSFNLGELFKLSVVQVNPDETDGAALPIQTSFDSQMTNPAPVRSDLFAAPTVLFPRNVLIRFTSTPEQFFPIHSGTANLAVSFTPGGSSSPRTVHVPVQINSAVPFTLGQAPSTFDNLIEAFADLRGIPAQILKAQIGQETAHRFRADTYRYEPLSVDFATVSAGKNLRTDRRFEPWRLATFPDFSTPLAGLPQGSSLAAHPDLLHLRERFRVVTGASGLPVTDLFFLGSEGVSFTSLPARNILPNDPPVSMENILFTNDQIQNWIRSL